MALKLSTTARNALGDALIAAIGNGGLLKVYEGTRPVSVAASLGSATLLGTLTCGSPFAPATASGVVTANAITQDSSADATGTAQFFRIFKSDGTTAVVDGDVGTSGSDLNLTTTSVSAGGPISVTSCILTMPGA